MQYWEEEIIDSIEHYWNYCSNTCAPVPQVNEVNYIIIESGQQLETNPISLRSLIKHEEEDNCYKEVSDGMSVEALKGAIWHKEDWPESEVDEVKVLTFKKRLLAPASAHNVMDELSFFLYRMPLIDKKK